MRYKLIILAAFFSLSCGNILTSGIFNTQPDTTPPMFSGIVSAIAVSNISVKLIWFNAIDNKSKSEDIQYLIYYWQDGVDPVDTVTPKLTTGKGATEISITPLVTNGKYIFVVRAKDLEGNLETNTNTRWTYVTWNGTGDAVYDSASYKYDMSFY